MQETSFGKHQLPDDFNGGTKIDGVAINREGTQFAYIENGKLEIVDVPYQGDFGVIVREGMSIVITKESDGSLHVAAQGAHDITGVSFRGSATGRVHAEVKTDVVGPGQSIVGVRFGE